MSSSNLFDRISWISIRMPFAARFALVGAVAMSVFGCVGSDSPFKKALIALPLTPTVGLVVNQALGMPSTTYVCILEPYSSRVDLRSPFAGQINEFLKQEAYLGDEGHWGFLHGTSENWNAEKIKRRSMELVELKDIYGKKTDSVCGYANSIMLNKPSDDKVIFRLMEKK